MDWYESAAMFLKRLKNNLSEPVKREKEGEDFKEMKSENILIKGAARPESKFESSSRAGLEKQVHCCSSQEQERFFPTPHSTLREIVQLVSKKNLVVSANDL